ncbi:MAG: outer membrane protein assembly factor BamA [bacterium]|nr:outer membrane protein assembly factor BamA [bacterium]
MSKRITILLLSSVYGLLSTNLAFAEKITDIVVEGVEKDVILKVITIKVGDEFSKDRLREDISSIYKLGRFRDIKVKIEEGVLTFIVEENPRISKITFTGNENFDEDELKKVAKLKDEDFFLENLLKEACFRLIDYYKKKGFYEVKVEENVESGEDNEQIIISFFITEGRKAKISKIVFNGNKLFSSWRLRWEMKTKRGGPYFEERLNEDLERIASLYRKKGYPLVEVNKKVTYSEEDKGLVIDIDIKEDQEFLIGNVRFFGNRIFSDEELYRPFKDTTSEIYTLATLQERKGDIYNLYSSSGYMGVEVDIFPFVDSENGKIDLVINIDEGERTYIEDIMVSGNVKTKDRVILREILFKKGELFNGEKLEKSRIKLMQLGFFEFVDMNILPGSSEDRIIINIMVQERSTGTANLGAGWNSEKGWIGTLEIAERNLFGRGYLINSKVERSKESTDYTIGFTNPWFFGTRTSIGFDIYDKTWRRKEEGYYERRTGGGLKIGRSIETFNKVHLKYKFEEVREKDIDKGHPRFSDEAKTTSSITLQLIRDTRDNIFDTTSGYIISLQDELAGGFLGGDIDFNKQIIEASYFIKTFWEFTLGLHGKLGKIENPISSKEIPDYERFYLGGAYTIRGYKLRSIHLMDESGKARGGRSMVLFNIEYRFPLAKPVTAALFFDAGNSFLDYIDMSNLRWGYGFGIRLDTPMGPIRLDYTLENDKKQEPGDQERFQFSIGSSF